MNPSRPGGEADRRSHRLRRRGHAQVQGTATHLIDHVLPRVPVRQWVLSLPRWARFLRARDPALITRALQIFLAEVFKSHRRRIFREDVLARPLEGGER